MKQGKRIIWKGVCYFFILLFLLFLVCGVWYGVKGYQMYQNAITETSITEKTAALEQEEHFVSYEALPQIYIDAVISVEDHRFFSHSGIDSIAIARALWNDLRTVSFAEGGSTITQQLAKNQYFTQEKTLERKFAEIFTAKAWEKTCEKEEIFALYVNTIYFGSGYYGIYEAAQGYFEVVPEELNDYEAIMLAGLPNAPTAYALDTHSDLAKQRMQQVLDCMISNQKLTQQEANEILAEERLSN